MTTSRSTSGDELRRRLDALLKRLGRTREQLAADAEDGRLTGPEFWLHEEVKAIEFLLDESEPAVQA